MMTYTARLFSILFVIAVCVSAMHVADADSCLRDVEFTGMLEKRKDIKEDLIYFVIKFDEPIVFNNKKVNEALLLIVDIPKLGEAFSKSGSKILVKGSMVPSQPDDFLDTSVVADELIFLN